MLSRPSAQALCSGRLGTVLSCGRPGNELPAWAARVPVAVALLGVPTRRSGQEGPGATLSHAWG